MNKKLFYVMCMGFAALFMIGCSKNSVEEKGNDNDNKSTYEKTESEVHNVSESQDSTTSKENSEQNSIKAGDSGVWTDEEKSLAENVADEFVNDLKNRDMNSISKKIFYPIEISETDGTSITISGEKEFSEIAFDKVFDKEFVDVMSTSKELFNNWRGFMLGSGNNCIWLEPRENGDVKIYSIINSHSVGNEDKEWASK